MSAIGLKVSDLNVSIDGKKLLTDVSFEVRSGQSVGFIGGSGSGKTLTALAVNGLLPRHAKVSGSVLLDGEEILGIDERELAKKRGLLTGMVFQEPKTALNPLRKLGVQMIEALTVHYSLSRAEKKAAALEVAERVGLKDPERITNSYPHEVSGGQRQRAAIAAAISAAPGIVFADEPTTALDVTVQQGIVELFQDFTKTARSSLVFITHDLAVLSQVAQYIYVFHEGRIIESASTLKLIENPIEQVTKELLLAAVPTKALELLNGGAE